VRVHARRHAGLVVVLGLAYGVLTSLGSSALAQTSSSDSSSTSSASSASSSTSNSSSSNTSSSSSDQPSEDVHGKLVDSKGTIDTKDDTPLVGVRITVTDAKGKDVGADQTKDDGTFKIPLPGEGSYKAKLDASTLPKGFKIDDPTAIRDFTVNPGQSRTLIFPLNAAARVTQSKFDLFLKSVVNGINFGLIVAMCAVGLSLIYGTTGLVNFAHGELVTMGAILAYYFNIGMGWPLFVAGPVAIVLTGLFGGLLDFGLWSPLRRRGAGNIAQMVISIGLALALVNFYLYMYGGLTKPYGDYNLQRAYEIGPIDIAPKTLVSSGICLFVLVATALALQRTRTGKAMRAIADNPDLASSSGIDVDRVVRVVWVLGAGLAALGGVLFSVSNFVFFQQGSQLLLLLFAAITLGGLGAAYGALVGGFVVGLFVEASATWIPSEMKNVGALAILILVLLVRPQGILGQAERIG
jgi:branched-chain amino acid transport system permease protein